MVYLPLLLALVVLLVAASVIIGRRADKQIDQLTEALQEQKCMRLIEMDEAIADWLVMLELPQLAEKKKRLEVARQLSTVLIGKLLRSPVPCCNSKT